MDTRHLRSLLPARREPFALGAALLLAMPLGTVLAQNTSSSGRHTLGDLAGVPLYTITPLGDEAAAIDGHGRVAVNQGTQAFLFVPSVPNGSQGSLTPLGTFGGSVSIGKTINRLGNVAGYSTLASGSYHSFLYAAGALTDIGTLSGGTSSARGINDVGQIVGFSYGPSVDEHGFLWTPTMINGTSGTMVDVGTLGGEYSEALSVNVHGEVVGFAYTPAGAFHAFRLGGGPMEDLGTLGGDYSRADAINDRGEIVGQAYLTGNAQAHACLWDRTGIHDLGGLGGNYSAALAIDPTGALVVGRATVPGGQFLEYRAFLYSNGVISDLNDSLPQGSGWLLERASGINGRGQIVGAGTLFGQQRGFLLTPR